MSDHQQQNGHEDYHGHPNYFVIWAVLVVILGISLGLGYLGNHTLAVTLIFALAFVKAFLVLANFMHLRWGPKAVTAIIIFSMIVLGYVFLGVYPDIVPIERIIAQ